MITRKMCDLSPTGHRDATPAFSSQLNSPILPVGSCWAPPPASPSARAAADPQKQQFGQDTGKRPKEHWCYLQACAGDMG